jgi:uncharacterized DUF497 family protein
LGHFGHQKHRRQADGHGLQFPKAPAFAADLPALAVRTDQSFGLAQQKKTDAAFAVFRPPILVSFADAKRMKQQTLTHASCYKILMPDENFPEDRHFLIGEGQTAISISSNV